MLYNRHSLNRFAHLVTGIGFDGTRDDPCPVEDSFTKKEVLKMLGEFSSVEVSVDYLFGTGWGRANRFIPKTAHRSLGRRVGWHLIIEAKK
jgi:hypothetical protein